MLHYESIIRQCRKEGYSVCGDHVEMFSFKDNYYFGIFDGIGSGIYANLAAIGIGSRWRTMILEDISITEACETIASDMNKARTGEAPFAAFSAMMLTNRGHASVYSYEAPKPVVRLSDVIQVFEPAFYSTGKEIIGESRFNLSENDLVLLMSDGVSQSGLGKGFTLGWGENGAASALESSLQHKTPEEAASALAAQCRTISGGINEDDLTILMVHGVKARHLSLFSGPPSKRERDKDYVDAFLKARGKRVICGSSTSGIFARELGLPVTLVSEGDGLSSPPRYAMEGADLVTEGALVLNQTVNLLNSNVSELMGETTPELLAQMLLDADVIDLYEGTAKNEAHKMLLFRQLGIRPRKDAMHSIEASLDAKGKMVHYHTF